jgi:hypothetical protein
VVNEDIVNLSKHNIEKKITVNFNYSVLMSHRFLGLEDEDTIADGSAKGVVRMIIGQTVYTRVWIEVVDIMHTRYHLTFALICLC